MKNIFYTTVTFLILGACNSDNKVVDAFGNFESNEVTVSSEVNGKLISFTLEEGQKLAIGEETGLVDTIQLYLKKEQLLASIEALESKTQNVKSEIAVWEEKQKNIEREYKRVQNLIKDKAATQQQLDDLKGQLDLTKKQLTATEIKLNNSNRAVLSQIKPLRIQIMQTEDQIQKSRLINPINGTILSKYVEESEIVNFGKPLYKIADLEHVFLRAYISENQLSQIKIGQDVTVAIDDGESQKKYNGKITWVSAVSEFTPKIIQTKAERKNLVYAVKVAVVNDGSIKLGMPGEMYLK